jgi:hypothetical protein
MRESRRLALERLIENIRSAHVVLYKILDKRNKVGNAVRINVD